MIQPIIILHTFVTSKFSSGRDQASEKLSGIFYAQNIRRRITPWQTVIECQCPVVGLVNGKCTPFFFSVHTT